MILPAHHRRGHTNLTVNPDIRQFDGHDTATYSPPVLVLYCSVLSCHVLRNNKSQRSSSEKNGPRPRGQWPLLRFNCFKTSLLCLPTSFFFFNGNPAEKNPVTLVKFSKTPRALLLVQTCEKFSRPLRRWHWGFRSTFERSDLWRRASASGCRMNCH